MNIIVSFVAFLLEDRREGLLDLIPIPNRVIFAPEEPLKFIYESL